MTYRIDDYLLPRVKVNGTLGYSGMIGAWRDAVEVDPHDLDDPRVSDEDWTADAQGGDIRDGWFDYDSAREELEAIYKYNVPVEVWDKCIAGSGTVQTKKIMEKIQKWLQRQTKLPRQKRKLPRRRPLPGPTVPRPLHLKSHSELTLEQRQAAIEKQQRDLKQGVVMRLQSNGRGYKTRGRKRKVRAGDLGII